MSGCNTHSLTHFAYCRPWLRVLLSYIAGRPSENSFADTRNGIRFDFRRYPLASARMLGLNCVPVLNGPKIPRVHKRGSDSRSKSNAGSFDSRAAQRTRTPCRESSLGQNQKAPETIRSEEEGVTAGAYNLGSQFPHNSHNSERFTSYSLSEVAQSRTVLRRWSRAKKIQDSSSLAWIRPPPAPPEKSGTQPN